MKKFFLAFTVICVFLSGCGGRKNDIGETRTSSVISGDGNAAGSAKTIAIPNFSRDTDIPSGEVPEYNGSAYVTVNNNIPFFEDSELTTSAFENYSPLDSLGRCGTAYANICKEIMPTEERGSIGSTKPSGWHTVKYDVVDGNYLYNRCHLIGFQLSGENANELNLITGTRFLNIMGMAPFEDLVAGYVKATGHHVLYRVSPVFEDDHLVAAGVLMEAKSVEDNGEGISFNVFCYNVQPGIEIDYASGDSRLADARAEPATDISYILNTNSGKFHYPECVSVKKTAGSHRQEVTWSREECITNGYKPCQNCNP